MRIIPAIDLINNQCVRLTKGDYNTKQIYNENPLLVAKEFEAAGIQDLHLVNLDAAKSYNEFNNLYTSILNTITSSTNLNTDFGGGIKSNEAIFAAFKAGAKQVTGGSIAVKDEALFSSWIETFGGEKIILGADVLDEKISIGGWQENTSINLFPFLEKYIEKGIEYVICTDISKDGMLDGPAINLYRKILSEFPDIKLIASGGVSSIEDVYELNELNLNGVIIGKAIYEQKITLKELETFMNKN